MGGFSNVAGGVASTAMTTGLATGATGMSALTAGMAALGPVGWGILAAGAASSLFSAKGRQDEARNRYNLFGEQIGDVKEAKAGVIESFEAQEGLALDIFGEESQAVGMQAGRGLQNIRKETDTLFSKSGMATSGEIAGMKTKMTEQTMEDYGVQMTSLENQLGGKILGLEEWKGGELGRLDSEMTRLNYERQKASKEMNSFGLDFLFG